MEEQKKPKVVVALIEKDGKFVLIRKKLPMFKLEWAFPGGVANPGETDEQTAVREAFEEVGMKVLPLEKLFERKHPNTLVQIAYVHCAPDDENEPVVGEPEEIAEAAWVNAEEVLTKFTSDVHPIIRSFVMSRVRTEPS